MLGKGWPWRGRRGDPATDLDVAGCYRVLLGRDPDPGGLAYYEARLRAGTITMADVLGELVASQEFRRGHRERLTEVDETALVDAGPFRIHVFPDDHAIGYAMAQTADYEPEVGQALADLLRPGAVFVDVGANYGWHSLLAASIVGEEGQVVAVEPNPLTAGLLRRSAATNGFDNIKVVVAGAAEHDGLGALETDGTNGRIIPLEGPPEQPVPCSFVVPLLRLDRIVEVAGVGHVDVVKIDVEGNELAAVRSGAGLLARDRPAIVTEFFPRALLGTGRIQPEEYLAELRRCGYELSVIGAPGARTDGDILAAVGASDHVDLVARPAG